MSVSSCTLSAFSYVMFSFGTGGHLHVERSYYSVFTNISSGEPGDEATFLIENTAAVSFHAIYMEHGKKGSIVFSNDVEAVGVRTLASARSGNLILENLAYIVAPVNHQVSAANLSQRNIFGKVDAP